MTADNSSMPTGYPRPITHLFVCLLMPAVAWWVWPPVGAFVGVFTLSTLDAPLKRAAVFWAPAASFVIGILWGTAFAVAAVLFGHLAFHANWARTAFAIFGLLAVMHLGYGTGQSRICPPAWEEKIVVAQVTGVFCYVPLVALALWMFW